LIEIWLVISIYTADHPPIKLEDSLQPDIPTCLARAQEALTNVMNVKGEYEFAIQCSVRKVEGDPA
jgi:hypothetical protein